MVKNLNRTIPLEFIPGHLRAPTGEIPPHTEKVISDMELARHLCFPEIGDAASGRKNYPIRK
jgi:hypothetical protein